MKEIMPAPGGKKLLFLVPVILLVAAACNKQPAPQTNNQPQQNQQTSQAIGETASWKTYQNTKYGYELKYPEGVTVEGHNAKASWPATENDDGILVGDLLDITPVNALGKCSDLRNERAIIICLGSVSWALQDRWVPVVISGLPAVRREVTLKPSPTTGSDIAPVGYIYYVNSGNTGLQVSFADSASRRPLMEQILATFKFTVAPNPTADWQTYTNSKYGFEIKYPSDATAQESTKLGGVVSVGKQEMDTYVGVGIDVMANTTNLAADKWYVQYYATKKQEAVNLPFFLSPSGENVSLNGYSAYRTADFGGDHSVLNYYLSHDSHIYVVHYNNNAANDPKWNEHKQIIDQILSTFKFVNTTSNSNSPGVNTFTSQKLGIQFNYLVSQGTPVIEEGDKVYVGGKTGQWVEEFSKNQSDDLQSAIKKKFLVGILEQDCPVVSYYKISTASNIETAEINFGFQPSDLEDPRIAASPCPKDYRITNGIRYFWMDKNYPDKFFFFSIGQYPILAEPNGVGGGGKTWQNTFEVIN